MIPLDEQLQVPMRPTNTYQLGTWWRESGPYDKWEAEQLKEFVKDHVIVEIDRCSTNTGGFILLVNGYEKRR